MKYIKLWEELVNEEQGAPIILIGPQGSGKSTTARALAEELDIPLIETDIEMINPAREEACREEPGVEVEITRSEGGGVNYSSNKAYEFCVIGKIFSSVQGPFVLDVGGSHAHWPEPLASKVKRLFSSTPNLFILGIAGPEDQEYRFLKGRRAGRGEPIRPEQEAGFKRTIGELRRFWQGANRISIVDAQGRDKSTEELVKEIKNKIVQ